MLALVQNGNVEVIINRLFYNIYLYHKRYIVTSLNISTISIYIVICFNDMATYLSFDKL